MPTSLFGRNGPSEDFFFFGLVNSLGAEDLANWEVNGERVKQGDLCMKCFFFFFPGFCFCFCSSQDSRIHCKQI